MLIDKKGVGAKRNTPCEEHGEMGCLVCFRNMLDRVSLQTRTAYPQSPTATRVYLNGLYLTGITTLEELCNGLPEGDYFLKREIVDGENILLIES